MEVDAGTLEDVNEEGGAKGGEELERGRDWPATGPPGAVDVPEAKVPPSVRRGDSRGEIRGEWYTLLAGDTEFTGPGLGISDRVSPKLRESWLSDRLEPPAFTFTLFPPAAISGDIINVCTALNAPELIVGDVKLE